VAAVAAALMFVPALAALRLFRRTQQHEVATAEEALQIDTRPPVIYLRSFKDDGLMTMPNVTASWLGAAVLMSPEQELALVLRRVGPVVAIGKPGEPLPELGAARLYVPHDRWQQAVASLLGCAAMVVVRVGTSAGVMWEVEQVFSHVPRERTVFLVLGSGDDLRTAVGALERRVGTRFGLDDLLAHHTISGRARRFLFQNPRRPFGAMIGFDAGGRPVVVPVRLASYRPSDILRSIWMRPFAGPLRAASRQLMATMGHEWRDVPHRSVAVVLAILFGMFGAHWWYVGDRRKALTRLALLPVGIVTLLLGWNDARRWLLDDRRSFDEAVASGR
jgi:hypothetical protein